MAYTIKLLEKAEREYNAAAVWHEEQSPGLGIRFIEVIKNKLNLIARYPKDTLNEKVIFGNAGKNFSLHHCLYSL